MTARSKPLRILVITRNLPPLIGGMERLMLNAIQGMDDNWKMRQHNLSPQYTTRWKDILVVDVDKWIDPNSSVTYSFTCTCIQTSALQEI